MILCTHQLLELDVPPREVLRFRPRLFPPAIEGCSVHHERDRIALIRRRHSPPYTTGRRSLVDRHDDRVLSIGEQSDDSLDTRLVPQNCSVFRPEDHDEATPRSRRRTGESNELEIIAGLLGTGADGC
jgi:hypothetical protein